VRCGTRRSSTPAKVELEIEASTHGVFEEALRATAELIRNSA